MTAVQFEAEKNYLAARQIAETFLKQELLKLDEFSRIDALLIERFHPPLGKLFSEKTPVSACNSSEKE